MFDFRRVTVFCLECRLSKHKMLDILKFGGPCPPAPLATPMRLASVKLVATFND